MGSPLDGRVVCKVDVKAITKRVGVEQKSLCWLLVFNPLDCLIGNYHQSRSAGPHSIYICIGHFTTHTDYITVIGDAVR